MRQTSSVYSYVHCDQEIKGYHHLLIEQRFAIFIAAVEKLDSLLEQNDECE